MVNFMKPATERVSKTITITNDIAQKLMQASKKLGISERDIIKHSLNEYLNRIELIKASECVIGESEQKFDFEPIGFGMWADRKDMEDSVAWVRKLREREWNCS